MADGDSRTEPQSHDHRSDGGDDGQWVEERFEVWARRVGRFVAIAAARAREQAEDIVAEAQSIRRGESD